RPPETAGWGSGSYRDAKVPPQPCAAPAPDPDRAAPAAGAGTASGPAVAVVGHTAGDPATGLLPDPSAASAALVLPPNTAYEVRFAWVPSGETCAPGNPDAGGKPPQTDSAGTSAGAGSGIASDPGAGAGQTPSGVAVSHTPQPGAATTRTTIPEACGGTVYRTGAIPVS
ncbi:hypothetical protein ACFVZQ_20110, partial [Streptomyces sp. NPDC059538]